jgi:hypothetical protein
VAGNVIIGREVEVKEDYEDKSRLRKIYEYETI